MKSFDVPIKSSNDKKEYRVIQLENGIKALLVSDTKEKFNSENTKKAAVALTIQAGSFDEPRDIPGLAHFLEHMITMGSEKYPDENAFDAFLKSYGGYFNAYTESYITGFYFDVQPKKLSEALERFSHYFIAPKLKVEAADREINAVDNECNNSASDNMHRLFHIVLGRAKKSHNHSRFTLGNKKTLYDTPKEKNIDVMKALRDFFDEFYLNRPICLVVSCPESLDVLEKMVVDNLSSIPSRSAIAPCVQPPHDSPYTAEDFHKLIYVLSSENDHTLLISWVIPSMFGLHRTLPGDFVENLISQASEGSLISCLKERGLAFSADGSTDSSPSHAKLWCSIDLTEKGLKNIHQVVHLVFQYITMLKQSTHLFERYFTETLNIATYEFRYVEDEDPVDYVLSLVKNMDTCAEKDYILIDYIVPDFDKKGILDTLKEVRTDNCMICIVSNRNKQLCTTTEPIYGTKYHVAGIPKDWIEPDICLKTNDVFSFPRINPFLITNFDIKDKESKNDPVIFSDSPSGRIWWKPDSKYLLPHAYVYCRFTFPIEDSKKYSVYNKVLGAIINEHHINEIDYEAEQVGLSFTSSLTENISFVLTFSGFNEKLEDLFKAVVGSRNDVNFSEEHFQVSKEEHIQAAENYLMDNDSIKECLAGLILVKAYLSPQEEWIILKDLTYQKLKEFAKLQFKQFYMENLYYGNITRNDILEYEDFIKRTFADTKTCLPEEAPKVVFRVLPEGRTVCRHVALNENEPTTIVQLTIELGEHDMRKRIAISLLTDMMEEPLFDILRTQKQLGYSVSCDHFCVCANGAYISFTVQTKADGKHSADEIDNCIWEFIDTFYQMLLDMSLEEHNNFVDTLVRSLQEERTMSEEFGFLTEEIYYEEYVFQRPQIKAKIAGEITQEELRTLMKTHMLDRKTVRSLSTQVIGDTAESDLSSSESDSDDVDENTTAKNDGENAKCDKDDVQDASSVMNDDLPDSVRLKCEVVTSEQYDRCVTDIPTFVKDLPLYSNKKPPSDMQLITDALATASL